MEKGEDGGAHPAIERIREKVEESKGGKCAWCGVVLKGKLLIEEHIKNHVLMDVFRAMALALRNLLDYNDEWRE